MLDSIHIVRWGDHGPRVILIHGSAQGSRVSGERHFAQQARLAERGLQLIVPDRPGHGLSAAPGRPDDAELDGAWVAELMEDGAHLVGHSFGGAVALAAAARRPDSARSLILIEPAMQALPEGDPRVDAWTQQVRSTMMGAAGPADIARRFAAIVRIPDEIRGGGSEGEFTRMGMGIIQLRVPKRETLQAELAVVKAHHIPLQIITGGWNEGFTGVGEAVARAGGGVHVVVPSEHHFPQNVGEEFNDLLVAFVSEAERRRAATN